MTDSTNIKQFLSHMTEKNYSQANQSLQKILEDKLKKRVKNCLDSKLASPKK